jgi:uncharacterized protein (TIGR02118 family)
MGRDAFTQEVGKFRRLIKYYGRSVILLVGRNAQHRRSSAQRRKIVSSSLQVLYPTDNGTTFDHAYFAAKHMKIVGELLGSHIENTMITKGLAGGQDTPAGFHVVATITFADELALDAALAAIGPAVADIPNFFSGQPQMLIGEVMN